MAQIVKLRFAQPLLSGDHRSAAPVWPREVADPPLRHPSRPKMRYRPRGQGHRDLADLWGMDDASQRERKATELFARIQGAPAADDSINASGERRQKESKRLVRGLAVGVPALGLVVTLAGYTAFQQPSPLTANTGGETARLVDPVAVTAPSLAATASLVRDTPVEQDRLPLTLQRPVFPAAFDSVPDLPAPFVVSLAPDLGQAIDTIAPRQPLRVRAALPDAPFVCVGCTPPPTPFLAGLTLSVFALTDPVSDLGALAGLGATAIRGPAPQIEVSRNQVRFYRTQDAAAAARLADRYAAALVDLTWVAQGGDTAQIDLLLAQHPESSVADN